MAPTPGNDGGQRVGFRKAVWGTAAALWMVPVIASLLIEDWHWGIGGHVFFAVVLTVIFGIYDLTTRGRRSVAYRVATAMAMLAGFGLFWGNLAVGILGEDNPGNRVYFAVVGFGLISAFIARFRPQGLAYVVFTMATVVGVAAVIVLSLQTAFRDNREILVSHGIFVGLLVSSGLLFRKAAGIERVNVGRG